ncbi:MAG: 1,4-alpha-glucan branching protein GlgB [Actinobacteria bacterium]|nr:1,4-alpha-glucan branching protein GlgB [Actinomycetota bacterium]MDA2960799.1 1,4-alpha-glucan branching protein GlgB [Actinomycetota bacterium]MDA2994340.1 1,4-alpha-glucan branching protein GlgB [Actinomycetota bacterium]
MTNARHVAPVLGEIDLHLFNEGTHRQLWRMLGPQRIGAGVRFAVWAPNAQRVEVLGDWNGWSGDELRPVGSSGVWVGIAENALSGQFYKFRVTGAHGREVMKADPMARRSELPPGDASIIPSDDIAFGWTDGDWMMSRRSVLLGEKPLRVYEVHAMSWRPDLTTWDDICEPLISHVQRLGFTHVEFLPLAEHPFGGSWGYQVTGFFSPTARLGDPDGLRRLVNRLHEAGIGVILDWVPAHFAKDSWSLGQFDGTALYEHVDPRRGEHPDWGTFIFNTARTEVRNFLINNALYWLEEFHVDGLRVDAVASMLYLDYSREDGEWVPNEDGGNDNRENVSFLQELNTVIGAEFGDVLMIAEESTAWPGVTHPTDAGGLGFSHKWNMGWMHDTLNYAHREAVHRRYHHGELSFNMLYTYGERYVLPLSHDEVVHGKGSLLARMSGDDWQKFATLRLTYGWQWAIPGPPVLFMGSEFAPWSEWNDVRGVEWWLNDHAPHAGMAELVGTLNALSDQHPALWRLDREPEGFDWIDNENAENSLYFFIRRSPEPSESVVVIANWTPVPRPAFRIGVPSQTTWTHILDTDSVRFGGSGYRATTARSELVTAEPVEWQGQPASVVVDIPPLSMLWLSEAAT